MCTAVTYRTKDFYFGRTLDYEFSYGEEITVTPRNYIFDFRHIGQLKSHYAIIGMAFVSEGYPLYYDAVNEKGLGMAGLNFVGNAAYKASVCGEKDIAQFEFIPWILSQCATVSEARAKLDGINLTGTPFSSQLPAAQLHWIIADKDEAITVESMKTDFIYMTIRSECLLTILHLICRCLHLIIMQGFQADSQIIHLQTSLS